MTEDKETKGQTAYNKRKRKYKNGDKTDTGERRTKTRGQETGTNYESERIKHKVNRGEEREEVRSCHCTAKARQGKARRGEARQGRARQGKTMKRKARQNTFCLPSWRTSLTSFVARGFA